MYNFVLKKTEFKMQRTQTIKSTKLQKRTQIKFDLNLKKTHTYKPKPKKIKSKTNKNSMKWIHTFQCVSLHLVADVTEPERTNKPFGNEEKERRVRMRQKNEGTNDWTNEQTLMEKVRGRFYNTKFSCLGFKNETLDLFLFFSSHLICFNPWL